MIKNIAFVFSIVFLSSLNPLLGQVQYITHPNTQDTLYRINWIVKVSEHSRNFPYVIDNYVIAGSLQDLYKKENGEHIPFASPELKELSDSIFISQSRRYVGAIDVRNFKEFVPPGNYAPGLYPSFGPTRRPTSNHIIFFKDEQTLSSISAQDASSLWSFSVPDSVKFRNTYLVLDGKILAGSTNGIYILDIASGTLLFHFLPGYTAQSEIKSQGEYVVFLAESPGTRSPDVFALNRNGLSRAWRFSSKDIFPWNWYYFHLDKNFVYLPAGDFFKLSLTTGKVQVQTKSRLHNPILGGDWGPYIKSTYYYEDGESRFILFDKETGKPWLDDGEDIYNHILHIELPNGEITNLGRTFWGEVQPNGDFYGITSYPQYLISVSSEGPW